MLSDIETSQLTGLLTELSVQDIQALVKTVTNTLMIPKDHDEAVKIILRYSPSVSSVLSRQKITKEVIFRHCHKMSVKGLNPGMTKAKMITLLGDHWEKEKKRKSRQLPEEKKKGKSSGSSERTVTIVVGSRSKTPAPDAVKEEDSESLNDNKEKENDTDEEKETVEEEKKIKEEKEDINKIKRSESKPSASIANKNTEIIKEQVTEEMSDHVDQSNQISLNAGTLYGNQLQIYHQFPSSTLQLFSETFVKWFYDLLNKGVSDSGQKFGPEHFWPDSYLSIKVTGPNLNAIEERQTGQDSCNLLCQMRNHFDVILNPNISADGVVSRTENHGLINIVVCGTAHRNDLCVGFFEQSFLLIRDPSMENNWRVKKSLMQMKTTIDVQRI
ncbi:uncharacterized protein LOC132199157 isoform X2 [Neocloeon triangulifer]|uniref:uncharacterized protein LOC132199157 isoform X2 n=1 Tax=Neocloeon triangulifer TaxID=2078957 RepID=UPI00286F78BB|nr:uncharacterized protein LOC132199157 isoform X2 [Neocloeon triangulifer]